MSDPSAPAPLTVLHVAPISIDRGTGMGRVAWAWRAAFLARDHRFHHLEVARQGHPILFPWRAWRAARRLEARTRPDLYLVHEPAAAPFTNLDTPLVLFSHGLERRGWEASLRYRGASGERIKARSRLLYPLWRLRPAEFALRRADAVLVLNQEDQAECRSRYRRSPRDLFVFRNGVDPAPDRPAGDRRATITILVLGTWMPRKGTRTIVDAACLLANRGQTVRWLIAGTAATESVVSGDFPEPVRPFVRVVPGFTADTEASLYAEADLFVLASFFEGQPLALLQAMASGLCCIATNCCGQRDLIRHERNGLLFERGDASGLAASVERCLGDQALRERLGREARHSVADRSWPVVAGEVVDFCEAVVRQTRRVGHGGGDA